MVGALNGLHAAGVTMAETDDQLESWSDTYASSFRTTKRHTELLETAVRSRLEDDGLNYHSVSGRPKDLVSVRTKLSKKLPDGSMKYPDGLEQLDDLIGVRVVTYTTLDVRSAVESLSQQFSVIESLDKTKEKQDAGLIGYGSHHLVVKVPDANTPAGCKPCVGVKFEIQVRTILQHAWAEFEHDIRYKAVKEVPANVHRAFTMAAGLLELADQQFDTIHETIRELEELKANASLVDVSSYPAEALTGRDLQVVLASAFPGNPASRAEQYEWLADVMRAAGIESVDAARRFFEDASAQTIQQQLQHKFAAGHVRLADDWLLSKVGDEYIEKTSGVGNDEHRRAKLAFRLKRIRAAGNN